MLVYGTPAPKRHHINIQGISPPSKRSNIGTKKANVTIRARRKSTHTGGQQIAQSIMNQLVKLTLLEQKPSMLEMLPLESSSYSNQHLTRHCVVLYLFHPSKKFLDYTIVDDDTLMHMLEVHFQVLDTNDYIAKLQAVHMVPSEQVDIQKIQFYAHFFLIFCVIILHTRILLQAEAQQNR